MGLTGGSELIVILMFLVTAEVMNASGMSLRLIAFAASLVGHLRGGMAYVCAADLAGRLGHLRLGPGRRGDHDPAAGAGDGARGLPARRGRRGRGGRLDQGGDRAAVGHVHRLRLAQAPGASVNALLLSGLAAVLLLLVFQMATVYVVVRRMDMLAKRRFAGWGDGRAHRRSPRCRSC